MCALLIVLLLILWLLTLFLTNRVDAQLKQWMTKYGWKEGGDHVYIANQEENIKTKNITEKIEFERKCSVLK